MRVVRLLAPLFLTICTSGAFAQERVAPPAPVRVSDPAPAPAQADASPWELGHGFSDSRFWAEGDYIVYWLKPVCLTVPTISSGNPLDRQPGALGQPGTELLQGQHKFEFGGANGAKARMGAWFTDDQSCGIEAEGFVLEQVTAGSPVTTQNGNPPTYLVFQNPDNSPGSLPFTIPGVVTGSSSAVGTSRLWGVDTNLSAHFTADKGPVTLNATWLFGARYLQLDDHVLITNRQALVANPAVTAEGDASFGTRNQFIGGQVGSRLGVVCGCMAFDLTTKLALGETHLVSTVSGSPLNGPSVLPPLVPGPLLALPSNLGQQASNRITVVPELNLRMRWQVREHVYLTLGYNLLYWNKILCPGDQMDPHVNTSELPFRGPPTGTPAPAPQFVFTDAFAHGLEAGLGFNF